LFGLIASFEATSRRHFRPKPRRGVIEPSLFRFIWKYSKREQILLLAQTVCLFPLLYLPLALPKRIINDALGAGRAPVDVLGYEMGLFNFLLLLASGFIPHVIWHDLTQMRIQTPTAA